MNCRTQIVVPGLVCRVPGIRYLSFLGLRFLSCQKKKKKRVLFSCVSGVGVPEIPVSGQRRLYQCPRDVSRGVPSILEGLFSHSLESICPDQAAALRISTKGLNYIVELIRHRGLAKPEGGQRLAKGE